MGITESFKAGRQQGQARKFLKALLEKRIGGKNFAEAFDFIVIALHHEPPVRGKMQMHSAAQRYPGGGKLPIQKGHESFLQFFQ
ncbi:MAG: hypothetical protein LBC94_06695 [Desulfovibrio sp.]|nr:hypothetical protein [Desulfovibrio sp.]